MERYKITWRAGDNVWENEKVFAALLDELTKDGQLADEFNLFISEPTTHAYHPLDRVQAKCESFKKAAAMVRAKGMRVGIDQWPSFGGSEPHQVDEREREMPFPSMVGMDGTITKRLACPVSPEFLQYTREKFRIFAKAGPDFIWVDDDCRFTHLGGTPYPCFCPRCVAGFEGGRFQDRASLVAALNRPENRQLRHKWSEYGAERLAAYCAAARAGVDDVDPSIDVPFMTVGYTHTTYSGDYIEKCMAAARSRAGRPGHGFYWDDEPRKMFHKTMDVSRQVLRYAHTALGDVQYEEESHPCTPLNKASEVRLMEAGLSVWGGCTGIAFNSLHVSEGERPFGHMGYALGRLREARPFFDRYLSFAKDLPQVGMWVADNEFLMAGMDVENGWFDEERRAYSLERVMNEWPEMGIVISADPRHAYATVLQGKVIGTFTDEEIREIFNKPVFMDALALKTLEERGLSACTGVRLGQAHIGLSEKLTDAAANGAFAGDARFGIFEPTYELLVESDDVEILSRNTNGFGEDMGACVTRRGNVTVFGYDPYRFLGTVGKLHQMRALLKDAGAPVMVEPADAYGVNHLSAWVRSDGRRAAVLLINASIEPALDTDIVIRGDMTGAVQLAIGQAEKPVPATHEDGCLKVRIPHMGAWEMRLLLAE